MVASARTAVTLYALHEAAKCIAIRVLNCSRKCLRSSSRGRRNKINKATTREMMARKAPRKFTRTTMGSDCRRLLELRLGLETQETTLGPFIYVADPYFEDSSSSIAPTIMAI